MKKFTSWIFALLISVGTLAAQAVIINSPDSLVGSYPFTTSFSNSWGADPNSGVWTADAVFVDDGSAMPDLGCNSPLVNDEALMGKIALVFRGACNFSLKAYYAQQAGAIAVVMFNNAPGGPAGMGAGTNAADVTIPVVMLSYEVGLSVKAAIAAGATVNITLGNIVFPNNLALSTDSVLVAPYGAYPISQIQAAGDFVVTPGVIVNNIGSNEASNVAVTATIDHVSLSGETTRVYEETNASVTSLDTSTTSDIVVFPEFDVFTSGMGVGTYLLSYEVASDSTEELSGGDNTVVTRFQITEDVLSKATINFATKLPNATAGYARGAGPPVEFTQFYEVPYGDGWQIDSVYFRASVNTGISLAEKVFDVFIYEWEDTNQDSTIQNDELTILALSNYTVDAAFTGTQIEVKVPLLDINTLEEASIPLEDDSVYGVGVRYQGTDQVFLGFDPSIDFTLNNLYVADMDSDLPYLGTAVFVDLLPDLETNGFTFTGLNVPFAPALYLSMVVGTNDIAGPDAFEMKLFPNPTSDQLQVDVELKENSDFIMYRVLNMQGQVINQVRKSAPASTDRHTVDATQLAAGQYILMVVTEQGVRAKHFVVSR